MGPTVSSRGTSRLPRIEPAPAGPARWLALPGFANLHAHADRAFTVDSLRPRSLPDALAAAAAARAAFTSAEYATGRGGCSSDRSAMALPACGRIPTSTRSSSCDPCKACSAARSDLAGSLDVDIIAFSTSRNDLAEPARRPASRGDRVEARPILGASSIPSPTRRARSRCCSTSPNHGLPVDLHLDEHLDSSRVARTHGGRCCDRARPARPRQHQPFLRAVRTGTETGAYR